MANISPVPTYADPVEAKEDPRTGKTKSKFSPVWLQWFLQISEGALASVTSHNALSSLQGGTTNEYYHLSSSEHTNVNIRSTAAPSGVTLAGSPHTHQNTHTYDVDIIVQGGTPTLVEFSRDGATFYDVGLVAGMYRLSPSDRIRITYGVAPTVTEVPR
jgi:hypothetical protein